MNHVLLSYIWYFLLALVWSIYIIQETFVVGVSMLSFKYNQQETKKLNSLVGVHWDGIQVWLILAVAGLLAAFPTVMGKIFSNLYVVIFLLLYIIIARGVSIELIYKSESKKFEQIATKCWQISSLLLILVIGIYITNLFVGLNIPDPTTINSFFSFMYIFNLIGILGGFLLVAHSLVNGYNFTKLNFKNNLADKMKPIAKYASICESIFTICILMGLNNKVNAFSKGLFQQHLILFILPVLAMLLMILSTFFTWKNNSLLSFITSNLAILFFVFTGFVSTVPYILFSSNTATSILIVDGSAGEKTLMAMFIATVIFLPIVIGYQLFKYIRFWGDKT